MKKDAPLKDDPAAKSRTRFYVEVALNFLIFKGAWWACVLGAMWGRPLLGVVCTLPALVAHMVMVKDFKREAIVIAAAGLYGYVFDSAYVLLGVQSFPENAQLLGPSPLWMVMLWMGFGACVRTALRFLFERPFWAVLSGAIVGPMSYRGGESLGPISIREGFWQGDLYLIVMWSLAMLFFCFLLKFTDGLKDQVKNLEG